MKTHKRTEPNHEGHEEHEGSNNGHKERNAHKNVRAGLNPAPYFVNFALFVVKRNKEEKLHGKASHESGDR